MGNVAAANGALLLASWASGKPRNVIEATVGSVRLGTVQATGRDVAWILTGISEIVAMVTAPTLADESKPEALRQSPDAARSVRKLARAMRRQAARTNAGLPGEVLWMTSLDLHEHPRQLSRTQILSLRQEGLVRSIDLMNGATDVDERRRRALEAVTNPRLANLVRDAARRWKRDDQEYCKNIHIRRATPLAGAGIVDALYSARGDAFEMAFAAALDYLAIRYEKMDVAGRVGYPDFLVTIEDYPGIVVELKTRASDSDLVSFNAAVEVLTASELIGMRDHACLTVCSPGVEPSVPALIEGCGRLCVVELCDFAEALLRVREGALSRGEFHNWLTTPGIALREDLPHPR
jgi:helicase